MDIRVILSDFLSSSSPDEKEEKTAQFLQELKKYKVVIYGAGSTGPLLMEALRMSGVEPLFFVDRRWRECKEVGGVGLREPEALKEVNSPEYLVIMAISAEVVREFNQEPIENIKKYSPDAVAIYAGFQVNRLLRYANCGKQLRDGTSFDLAKCLDCGAETELCDIYVEYLRRTAPERKTQICMKSSKFDWFSYIMGQYCSLKCRDCCEHVPYLKNPVFSDCETILSDCSKIAGSCELLRYIELAGGEPLLHPEFKQILEGLLQIENVGFIRIFTNGTVLPKDEWLEVLKNPRIVLCVSNYTGQVNRRVVDHIHRTIKKLTDHHVRFSFNVGQEWTDWGDFHDRSWGKEELANHFTNCFCANSHRVFQGILYRCSHQYAGAQLGELELPEGDYVDLHAWTSEKLARKLEEFEELPYIDACRYCDMPFDCPVVPAGVQLE